MCESAGGSECCLSVCLPLQPPEFWDGSWDECLEAAAAGGQVGQCSGRTDGPTMSAILTLLPTLWSGPIRESVCVGAGGWGERRRLQRPVSPRHAYSTAHTPNLRLKGLPLCGRRRGKGGGPRNNGGHTIGEAAEGSCIMRVGWGFNSPRGASEGRNTWPWSSVAPLLPLLCTRVGEKGVWR